MLLIFFMKRHTKMSYFPYKKWWELGDYFFLLVLGMSKVVKKKKKSHLWTKMSKYPKWL